ncbi:fa5a655b-4157-474b-b337-683f9a6406ac [Sclerotinia trifoliorum]|uniref:Fa5a655b-4157-474b-b337-683f9a6406ac n=1 Tax=Sclerotinia trifoliorum TaxID=28548 RepID=A0A8H2VVL6_9HELO|nr:fa5a655b-4157-474b-b337-683f9a6406ac [Sclerotinia trifoliorum]
MPPMPGQKGTGKKGRDPRQSRSRNTTPSLVGASSSVVTSDAGKTPYTQIPINILRTSVADEIAEQHTSTIPNSRELEALMQRMERLASSVDERAAVCDKGMRVLAQSRKERNEELEIEKRDEDLKERMKRDLAEEEERGRHKAHKIKKRKDVSSAREERPLTHGAHGLAPQDGSNLEVAVPSRDYTHKHHRKLSKERDNDSISSSLSPPAPATPTAGMNADTKQKDAVEDESSSDEHQPPPAPKIPNYQTFGPDPSTFPDPTVYEITKIKPGDPRMSEEEKKMVYSVAVYPTNDLHDLIPGTPPDKDFSNAKPTNQVQANTFATYLEPYFRPFTEEDLAFLRERGDRVNPFIIPRRGKKHYTEIWAEEDGAMSVDTPHQGRDKLPPNQARGSIDDIDDAIAETDQVSAGPILSRLLATLRPENRAPPSEDKPMINGISNGEGSFNGEMNGDMAEPSQHSDTSPLPPATFMPDSASESWKKANHPKLDHAQVDERIKQELRHIGFLPPDTEPDYDAHYDDEIAARLRFLQTKLREQSIINGARKARLQEITKERMAHQEYQTILEDLDGQVNAAYTKRSRTIGKTKKNKKSGGAGGGNQAVNGTAGTARPGLGDVTKTLMEKRQKWIKNIGAVFDDERNLGKVPRSKDEGSSIFKPEIMAEFIQKEKDGWDEDGDEE